MTKRYQLTDRLYTSVLRVYMPSSSWVYDMLLDEIYNPIYLQLRDQLREHVRNSIESLKQSELK
jgi:hypothetical protein